MSHDPRHAQPGATAPDAPSTRNRAIAIGLSAAVVAGLVAFGSFLLLENSAADERSDHASAAQDGKHPDGHGDTEGGAIEGLKSWDAAKLDRNHVTGTVDCPMRPAVGGDHHPSWMNCDGDVYEKPVPDVNAVHSLEHGAVSITYNDKAADSDAAALAERVQWTPFTLMSPYAGQEGALTLSAWGKQVTVDSADDPRTSSSPGTSRAPRRPSPAPPAPAGWLRRPGDRHHGCDRHP